MTVHVEFLGPVRRPWPEREREVEVAQGCTVAELMTTALGYTHEESRFLSVVVNGERGAPGSVLADGDRVILTLVVGGG